ncbi:MAG: DUF192 domain-containing protein [Candidatus Diapherotrites archaeon]|nr:DUF192 domain-containing protein [Candidatus Diapherotrites archaeon]
MLKNTSKKNNIAGKVRIADNYFSKMRGLMFEHKKKFDYALVLCLDEESRIKASIHMLFVFFPIAVFFLDSRKKVVDKKLMKPFALNYTPKKPSKYIVELPAEKIDAADIGDILSWN